MAPDQARAATPETQTRAERVALRCAHWQHQHWWAARRDMAADVERYLTKSAQNLALGRSAKRRLSARLTPELMCLALHRVAHFLHASGWPRLARVVAAFNTLVHKVRISPESCIGPGCRLSHPPGVSFHGSAGHGLTLFSCAVCCTASAAVDGRLDNAPYLGDEVTVGAHSAVMGPVQVGDRVRISYLTQVTGDVAAGAYVVGGRARIQADTPASAVQLRPSASQGQQTQSAEFT
jgi:serine O-acetyltransferase